MNREALKLLRGVISELVSCQIEYGDMCQINSNARHLVEQSASVGVFCRRWGVPLIDGGTFRLPRLIGLSRALVRLQTQPSLLAITDRNNRI